MADKPTLKEIHNKYINELLSLDRTCAWLEADFGMKINRQRLSRDFKRRGLTVFLPNGWGDHETLWRDYTLFYDEVSQFCGAMVKSSWEDIISPSLRIHYLSAAAFIASGFYEGCLGSMMRNVRSLSIHREMLPEGVDIDEILEANDLYERNYHYWVSD